MEERIISADILGNYPSLDEKILDDLLKKEIEANDTKIVVLDDDPTGVQTVHDISVFTDWSYDSILAGFREVNKLFYILTNSRGMTDEETAKIHKDIASVVSKVSHETGEKYMIISRSDSTLRGHYPLETEILKECMEEEGTSVDGEILFPFFKEGGRFTIDNVHYVKQGDKLIPAAMTEFAKDKTFGYTHSSIPEYVEEKTKGKYRAEDVLCISLEELREMDFIGIQEKLGTVTDFNKVCVNAIDYCDVKVFCIALYRAMANGKRFLFRTAAGFVKVVGGISDIPLLTRDDMMKGETGNGGLVIVGSHTQKSTDQLNELLKLDCVVPVLFNSDAVMSGDEAFYAEVDRCKALEEEIIKSGKTAVCYTCRNEIEAEDDTPESALLRSVKISDGVWRLVGELNVKPAFLIAKGGITSSDIGTKALRVKRAKVLGQIRPGIPVWQTGTESRFPGISYIIFPGNVGETETLREVVDELTTEN